MSKVTPFIAKTLLDARRALVAERAKAIAEWDARIAEIDAFLEPQQTQQPIDYGAQLRALEAQPEIERVETPKANQANRLAVAIAVSILKRVGTPLKTPDLYSAVQRRGVRLLAKNPEERFAQLLSGRRDIFQSDRKNGWSLKSESAVGAALSGASASEEAR